MKRSESLNYNKSISGEYIKSIEYVNVNGNARECEFIDIKSITINGNARNCKFTNCTNITVNGNCRLTNAFKCSTFRINGNCRITTFNTIETLAIHGNVQEVKLLSIRKSNIQFGGIISDVTLDGIPYAPSVCPNDTDLDIQTGGFFGTLGSVTINGDVDFSGDGINISGCSFTSNVSIGHSITVGGKRISGPAIIKKRGGPILYSSAKPATQPWEKKEVSNSGLYDTPPWIPTTLKEFLQQMDLSISLKLFNQTGFYNIQDIADIQEEFGVDIVSSETGIATEKILMLISNARALRGSSAPAQNILSRICIQCKDKVATHQSQNSGLVYCSKKCYTDTEK